MRIEFQNISSALRRERRAREITQVELAERAELGTNTVQRIEYCDGDVMTSSILAYVNALGWTLADLHDAMEAV
jgi:transcriptional regulator with XRE-family HTH domain